MREKEKRSQIADHGSQKGVQSFFCMSNYDLRTVNCDLISHLFQLPRTAFEDHQCDSGHQDIGGQYGIEYTVFSQAQ